MPALNLTTSSTVQLTWSTLICVFSSQELSITSMELSRLAMRGPARASAFRGGRTAALAVSPMAIWSRRQFSLSSGSPIPGPPGIGFGSSQSSSPQAYFQRSSRLPTNTVIKFVPQQTAWIVERMGKFSRILSPGLAILMPVIEVCYNHCESGNPTDQKTENRLCPKSERVRHRDSQPERHHGRQRDIGAGWCAIHKSR